jgi:hypothetical protein
MLRPLLAILLVFSFGVALAPPARAVADAGCIPAVPWPVLWPTFPTLPVTTFTPIAYPPRPAIPPTAILPPCGIGGRDFRSPSTCPAGNPLPVVSADTMAYCGTVPPALCTIPAACVPACAALGPLLCTQLLGVAPGATVACSGVVDPKLGTGPYEAMVVGLDLDYDGHLNLLTALGAPNPFPPEPAQWDFPPFPGAPYIPLGTHVTWITNTGATWARVIAYPVDPVFPGPDVVDVVCG